MRSKLLILFIVAASSVMSQSYDIISMGRGDEPLNKATGWLRINGATTRFQYARYTYTVVVDDRTKAYAQTNSGYKYISWAATLSVKDKRDEIMWVENQVDKGRMFSLVPYDRTKDILYIVVRVAEN